MATATVVKKTRVMANAEIGRIDALNSCQDVLDAASYNSGGSKMIKITSGSSCRFGNWGTKPMINPAATKRIGKGRLRLLTRAVKLIRIAMIKTTTLKFSMLAKCTQKPGRSPYCNWKKYFPNWPIS